MKSRLDTTLKDVAEDTFASLAFMLPLSEDERELLGSSQESGGRRVSARVEFSGPFTGVLVLSVDAWILQPLASNMLGLLGECTVSVDQQYDSLKELSNVICGNLLPRIGTPQDVFKVHSPEILEDEADGELALGRPPESHIRFWVEGGQADLALFTERTVSTPAA